MFLIKCLTFDLCGFIQGLMLTPEQAMHKIKLRLWQLPAHVFKVKVLFISDFTNTDRFNAPIS